MIVYHGSFMTVKKTDIEHSFRQLDFGKGFYVTGNYEQAENWARRKVLIMGKGSPIINIYKMNENWDGLRVKTFDENLVEWLDFVCGCRDEELFYQQYDMITGKVANDKVFRVIDMYRSGDWSRERALKEIKVYPNYEQTAFITSKAIERLLTFSGFQEV